jgi:hypothetical protein
MPVLPGLVAFYVRRRRTRRDGASVEPNGRFGGNRRQTEQPRKRLKGGLHKTVADWQAIGNVDMLNVGW